MKDPLHEALKRALSICGGTRPLCARLGVGAAKLQAWLDGEVIPAAQLTKVIEILLNDYDAWRAQDRRSEPRHRVRAAKRAPAGIV
jgi:hypothetical protein